MTERRPRYSKEEFRRRGEEIFQRKIRTLVEHENPRKYVAIDVESEDFEVDCDLLAASDRLIAKNPDAQLWMRRVGSIYTAHFGGSVLGRGELRMRKLTG